MRNVNFFEMMDRGDVDLVDECDVEMMDRREVEMMDSRGAEFNNSLRVPLAGGELVIRPATKSKETKVRPLYKNAFTITMTGVVEGEQRESHVEYLVNEAHVKEMFETLQSYGIVDKVGGVVQKRASVPGMGNVFFTKVSVDYYTKKGVGYGCVMSALPKLTKDGSWEIPKDERVPSGELYLNKEKGSDLSAAKAHESNAYVLRFSARDQGGSALRSIVTTYTMSEASVQSMVRMFANFGILDSKGVPSLIPTPSVFGQAALTDFDVYKLTKKGKVKEMIAINSILADVDQGLDWGLEKKSKKSKKR